MYPNSKSLQGSKDVELPSTPDALRAYSVLT